MKTKNSILIEDVELVNGTVTVDYDFNNTPTITKICYDDLKQFALNRNMNEFVNDACVNGEHEQTEMVMDIEEYMIENLNKVVLEYLLEYPLESVNIQLGNMINRLSA